MRVAITRAGATEGQGQQPSAGRDFTNAVQVAASILGLAGYVYLIGGVVSWVRFDAALLPADAAVGALESRTLFEVGLRSIVLMGIVFAIVSFVAYHAAGNWEANGPDWHELVRRRGVRAATDQLKDPDVREAWSARRARALSAGRARHLDRVATAVKVVPPLATHTKRRADHHREAAGAANPAAAANETKQRPTPPTHPFVEPAPLGDRAVRVVAGFNNLVLSAVGGVAVARLMEFLFQTWWAILLVWLIAGWLIHRLLARWGPLHWGPLAHGLAWLFVGLVALFVSAPIGLLVIAGAAVSTLGRILARVSRPQSWAQFLRSPLPWALFTFYLLVGLAFYATPPVLFQRAVVATTTGDRVGGYLSRSPGSVFLVMCTPLADATSTGERVVQIDATDVRGLSLGGPSDRLDSGARPSLAALATRALGIDAHPPTVFRVDLRARQGTCAGAPPESLSVGTEDPALGAGAIAGPAPPGGRAHDAEQPIEQTTPAAITRLARLYQPTVEVTVADRFWPVSVGAVLSDAGASGGRTCLVSSGFPGCARVSSLSSLVPAASHTADYLRYPAGLHNDPTNQFLAFERGQSIVPGSRHNWLADPGLLDPWYTAQVYFYYAGTIDRSQWPQAARNPDVPRKLVGLEYWFFYPFNYYPTVVGSELINDAPLAGDTTNTDRHQGDWEHVVVLLDPATFKPMWLYMARHADEGQFFPWDSPTLALDHGHPIVQAAFGGHPTYPSHCGPRYRPRVDDVSADWIVCGSGRFAFRAATTPLVDLAQTTWGCWKGHFGEAKPGFEVNAPRESDDVLVQAREFAFVQGPPSPLWQAENYGGTTKKGVCTGPAPKTLEPAEARQIASHTGAGGGGRRP
jgi:hypothetical protein